MFLISSLKHLIFKCNRKWNWSFDSPIFVQVITTEKYDAHLHISATEIYPFQLVYKFHQYSPTSTIPALIWIMGWRRPGDKPLSEPMMVRLPMHVCVTRPQWVYYWNMYIRITKRPRIHTLENKDKFHCIGKRFLSSNVLDLYADIYKGRYCIRH